LAAASAAYTHKDRRLVYAGMPAAAAAAVAAFLLTTPWFIQLLKYYFQRFAYETLLQSSGALGYIHAQRWDFFLSLTPAWETPWLGSSILANGGPLVILVVGVDGAGKRAMLVEPTEAELSNGIPVVPFGLIMPVRKP